MLTDEVSHTISGIVICWNFSILVIKDFKKGKKDTHSVTIFQIVDQCCINRLHLHVYGGLDYKLLVADRKRSMIYCHLSQLKLLKLTRFIQKQNY